MGSVDAKPMGILIIHYVLGNGLKQTTLAMQWYSNSIIIRCTTLTSCYSQENKNSLSTGDPENSGLSNIQLAFAIS